MTRTAAIIALALLLGGCSMFVERPDYTVTERFDEFELRRYPSTIVAETRVSGSFAEVGNKAFPILAGYIGGENRRQEEIAMTAPVKQTPAGGGEKIPMTAPVVQEPAAGDAEAYVLGFVMPAARSMEGLPEPTDPRVRLRRIEGRLMAARRYSGTWSRERYQRQLETLLSAVRAAGFSVTGEPVFARYNPPITPWFLRRNEVLVAVRPD